MDITGQKVLVRVDWNLPNLQAVERIRASLPTLLELFRNNNTIILLTSWGRPNGQRDNEFSTEKLIPLLGRELLGSGIDTTIFFADQTVNFQAARNTINSCGLNGKNIVLLENTRFLQDEESSDKNIRLTLAAQYATLGNYYVNEAFSVSHRVEATITELETLLPSELGVNYQDEITHLKALKRAKSPYVVVLGGAKLETKLPLLDKLVQVADQVLLAGTICFPFLRETNNLDLKDTKVDTEYSAQVVELLNKYSDKILLPSDLIFEEKNGGTRAVDIGEKTIEEYTKILESAKTIFWNGTIGYVEGRFVTGNQAIAQTMTANYRAYTVVGGGNTVASLAPELLSEFGWVSTGGGATLNFLTKK